MYNSVPKILVVDDDEDILELLEYNLSNEGYEVQTAGDGKEAVEKAKTFLPNLILLDIMMPVMDGIEAGRRIREIPDLRKSFLIFLTARSEEYSEVAAFEIGANDYLIKPVKLRALISRIRALFKRDDEEPKEGKGKIQVKELTVNTQNYTLARLNNSWVLPKKEFDLLMFFIQNSDKVYTRYEILSNVWGVGIHVSERTVDVHIRKLREKIGEDFIKTIKGVGYLFSHS
ncbi:two-component system, OmpR family, alkaline phosphatase synthesis response regulator PhoP [Pseudarcicella hirudinis]|uniref:Two-component system, OmpR family, alkaline phosphatase synthesis response regulator PhoP n=1 Tax=Pseudarcicella hirudinis TaxID=1079859 RepID=A0A1I5VG16_9BACT|nr:response regulator transcription factor [Pseudarcicella hirudinis]SFQ05936.1 two-component system, OmpR family, alkaline phosphatase synthesis response regulator PhoP [Pseudarcicella hirudinis]